MLKTIFLKLMRLCVVLINNFTTAALESGNEILEMNGCVYEPIMTEDVL